MFLGNILSISLESSTPLKPAEMITVDSSMYSNLKGTNSFNVTYIQK